MEQVQVYVKNISYTGFSDTCVLVLGDIDSERQLPIVIDKSEAFNIQRVINNSSKGELPFLEDMLKTVMEQAKITMLEAVIYKFNDGIFHAQIICHPEENSPIETRVGTAIIMAHQTNTPVFIDKKLIDQFGMEEENTDDFDEESADNNLKAESTENLYKLMEEALNHEFYELAAKIHEEISRRKTT